MVTILATHKFYFGQNVWIQFRHGACHNRQIGRLAEPNHSLAGAFLRSLLNYVPDCLTAARLIVTIDLRLHFAGCKIISRFLFANIEVRR